MKRTAFLTLALAAPVAAIALGCGPAEVVRVPAAPPRSGPIVLPRAANMLDMVSAPVVVVDAGRVTVDGQPAGAVGFIEATGRIQRVDELFEVLKTKRVAWKQEHPGAPFPGAVVFRLDEGTKAVVVKSLFQTAAFAGYPNGSFMVQSLGSAAGGTPTIGRIAADAQVPGPPRAVDAAEPPPPEKVLHVDVAKDKFILSWSQEGVVLATIDVPREKTAAAGGALRFAELAAKVSAEWKQNAQHLAATDKRWDQAVVFVPNDEDQRTLIAAIDAVYTPKRPLAVAEKTEEVPAFNVTLAMNPRGSLTAATGRLAPEVIQRVVRANFGTFRSCYEAGLKRNSSLEGKVEVIFVIERDGTVSHAEDNHPAGALPDPAVTSCITAAYGKLVFPKPDGGIVKVVYPIVFNPG